MFAYWLVTISEKRQPVKVSALFPVRIQRLSYVLRMLICFVPCILLGLLLGYLGHAYPSFLESPALRPLLLLFYGAWYIYVAMFVAAPRLVDIGLPRLCVLLVLIPGLNLALGLMALFA